MTKETTIQIRISHEDKVLLSAAAGGPLGPWLRDLGLEAARVRNVGAAAAEGSPGGPPSGPGRVGSEGIAALQPAEDEFNRLVTQLKGQGMTTPVARREAKVRLGL